jgi:hypothetical protein
MRAVTFADPRVVDLMNERFVVVWNNHSMDQTTRGVQATYSKEEMAAYPEGGGGNNLHTVVAASDGTVLNSISGYWSADTLLEELEFCRGLTAENRAERQVARAKSLRAEITRLEEAHPEEMRKRPKDSAIVRRKAALNLLALSHSPEAIAASNGLEAWLSDIAERSRARVHV